VRDVGRVIGSWAYPKRGRIVDWPGCAYDLAAKLRVVGRIDDVAQVMFPLTLDAPLT
jgi:hypothetical protein